jgi:NAD-dependent oxidoreductase involved in siderophore biosynthesis
MQRGWHYMDCGGAAGSGDTALAVRGLARWHSQSGVYPPPQSILTRARRTGVQPILNRYSPHVRAIRRYADSIVNLLAHGPAYCEAQCRNLYLIAQCVALAT